MHKAEYSSERHLSGLDRLLLQVDRALRTLSPGIPSHGRISPAHNCDEVHLNDVQRRHSAGLMRVNHTGEVCAQALYQGQALTAKLPDVRIEMESAADEEIDHLAWCESRLQELGSRSSLLNPLWYGLSFMLGAAAGKVGDNISLGFVAATEEQVCKHLQDHLQQLPSEDQKSRAVVEQMLEDEAKHQHAALDAGGVRFPAPAKHLMSLISKCMTSVSYRV